MDSAADLQTLAPDLETALSGLVRLSNALNFYPADHPALSSFIEEAYSDFQPLLKHHNSHPYHVTQAGFSLNDVPLAPKNKSIRRLALKLVERRVRYLLFLPEMANYELLVLADELSKPVAEILAAGGLAKRLTEQQIKSIRINETNLNAIPSAAQQPGARKSLATLPETLGQQSVSVPTSAIAAQDQIAPENPLCDADRMRDLLEKLKEPQDDQTYQNLLGQVQTLANSFFSTTGIVGQLAVFTLLNNHCQDNQHSRTQKQAAERLIDRLLSVSTVKTLADAVAGEHLKASQQRALGKLLASLGSKVAAQLLKRYYAEREAVNRRLYSDILARMGVEIFDLLRKGLQSDTWHVVRNVVTVLGETRLETALPLLSQAIGHPDVRVRRAVIPALGAIGGSSVIPPLLRLSQAAEAELHQPAIMALGALKNPRAIPPLVELLKKSDPFCRQTLLKTEVIQALATTRSPQAIIPLLKLARRPNLLNRKGVETLRAEAILALGQLGNSQLIPVLENLPGREKDPVCKALQQVKVQLQKQPHAV